MNTTLFVVIDGLRPDAIAATTSPNLDALMNQGSYSLHATSVMPSVTLPCHMSMFHSVPPTRHGVTTNTYQPMARPLPGLIEQANTVGKHCAFVYNWEQLRDCSRPGNLRYSYYASSSHKLEKGDAQIAENAAAYLRDKQPDFMFLYLGSTDAGGHDFGWMSEDYLSQITRADQALGIALQALDRDDFVLLQSDHGGHERSHGTDSPDDMTIPWIIRGPDVKQGFQIPVPVSLLDTAPTLAKCLDIPVHPEWEGRVVTEVFA